LTLHAWNIIFFATSDSIIKVRTVTIQIYQAII
jgi:hypothetical protein